ncbi:MAG: hypothetical protein AAGI23_08910 [Bacteroidota bacterium]
MVHYRINFPDRRYIAASLSAHHKWLIDDRWIIQPMVLTDWRLGFSNNGNPDERIISSSSGFDLQFRLYAGYRFGGKEK